MGRKTERGGGGGGGGKEGSIATERLVLGLCMFVFPSAAGIYCRHRQGQPRGGERPAG